MAQPRSGAARSRRRVHIGAIALCALLISLGGSRSDGTDLLPPVSAASASAALLDSDDLGRALVHWNPDLSPRAIDRISSAILRYSGKYELDPELVAAVIFVESRARPDARSPKGALGLMQVMPHMLAPMHLAGNATTIESNIEAGCVILSDNIRRLGEEDGILTYFWGSRIRNDGYLRRVRSAQAEFRRLILSS